MSKKTRVSDGKSLGDGRTEGDGGRQAGDDGGSGLKQEGSKGGGECGMKDHSVRDVPEWALWNDTDKGGQYIGTLGSQGLSTSYKDKLMCLGESGLLEPHFSAAKALSGWKDYFAKTNETQGSKEMEGNDEGVELEEEAVDAWRRFKGGGRISIHGKQITEEGSGVGADSGPSHELYNVESIRRIGNMIGKTLKIDRTTAFSEKGGFARMCVEVDLQKPLLPGFSHFGEERRFKYEGLHLVCFTCGRYGHRMDQCTVTTQSKEPGNSSSEALPWPRRCRRIHRSRSK
ncbi:hypothetical protein K1719_008108 [Acacia pycnantha]|nr:hypothetical protein K1719_008108 [Acacia pycnantha]